MEQRYGRDYRIDPKRETTGYTRVIYLLSGDASKSLSPSMHNAALSAMGERGRYTYHAISVTPQNLHDYVKVLSDSAAGFGVTQPHKEKILDELEHIGEAANAIKAVNTVVITRSDDGNPELSGYNTDWMGIAAALEKRGIETQGKRTLIFGAGGVARAAVYAMKKEGTEVTIINRTPARAYELARDFECTAVQSIDDIEDIGEYDFIIDATGQGVNENGEFIVPIEKLHKGQVLIDLAYLPNKRRTPMIEEALRRRVTTIDGREILLYQGISQLSIILGRDPLPEEALDAMRRIAMRGIIETDKTLSIV